MKVDANYIENYIKKSKESKESKEDLKIYVSERLSQQGSVIKIEDLKKYFENETIKPYIDLKYKEGRFFEYCCLSRSKYMECVSFVVDWSKNNNQEIPQIAKDGALISAVTFNKFDLVKYLLSDEVGVPADMSYANYACVNNAMPKNGSAIKEQMLHYFIFDMLLEKNKSLIKIIKKNKRLDVLTWFDLRDLKNSLTQDLSDNKIVKKYCKV